MDATGRYGGGAWCIANGLGLVDGGGMVGYLDTGQALIDGIVTLNSAHSIALVDGRQHIFLLATGDVAEPITTLSDPEGACAYCGSIKTVADAVTELDRSGVLFMRGGMLWRKTADAGVPGDTPPASLSFFAETAGGLYVWSGSAYYQVA
jgi:hypothetical protein